MTVEDEIRSASKEFYAAMNRMLAGDASSLRNIWSHSSTVTTMHPIGGRQVGWEQVNQSFDQVAKSSTGGQVELADQLIHAAGVTAYEFGVEHARFSIAGEPLSVNSRVTNIDHREAGVWKIVHHHGDKSPGISDALGRANKSKSSPFFSVHRSIFVCSFSGPRVGRSRKNFDGTPVFLAGASLRECEAAHQAVSAWPSTSRYAFPPRRD
jgi:ketosteroid isomerase-like protein